MIPWSSKMKGPAKLLDHPMNPAATRINGNQNAVRRRNEEESGSDDTTVSFLRGCFHARRNKKMYSKRRAAYRVGWRL